MSLIVNHAIVSCILSSFYCLTTIQSNKAIFELTNNKIILIMTFSLSALSAVHQIPLDYDNIFVCIIY